MSNEIIGLALGVVSEKLTPEQAVSQTGQCLRSVRLERH